MGNDATPLGRDLRVEDELPKEPRRDERDEQPIMSSPPRPLPSILGDGVESFLPPSPPIIIMEGNPSMDGIIIPPGEKGPGNCMLLLLFKNPPA
jgi:hypothetical protein